MVQTSGLCFEDSMKFNALIRYAAPGYSLFCLLCCLACQSSPGTKARPAATPHSAAKPSEAPMPTASPLTSPALFRDITWSFEETGLGPSTVHITIPRHASATHPVPVLIALHGMGEARKSPSEGALGWPRDYGMHAALKRLHAPPLTGRDFGDMITKPRLSALNGQLKAHPYGDLIVVSPYIPDRFGKWLQRDARVYGAFLTETLLPRIYRELPAIKDPGHTAIDGVSLGGRAAIAIGLTHPGHFGAVGGIQAAFGERQIPMIVHLLKMARAQHPNLKFRLLSSDRDVYRDVTETLSATLQNKGVRHQYDIVSGNHSYEFNRGPGVYEMLIYYDAILRGRPFINNSSSILTD